MIQGLAPWEQIAFLASLAVILAGFVSNAWLYRLARRPIPVPDTVLAVDDFAWVFLVPALNEEVTIADSVSRLLAVRCPNKRIVVIDDGSTDRTPDVLASITDPTLTVLRREPPDAQRGKAAALNHAWREVHRVDPDLDPMRTIVCIVDADGRLDVDAPAKVGELFSDPTVAGVQVRVRIYNRHSALTRAQDIEFGVYGHLYQAARSQLGTAGMGGNGQFNRLAALDDVSRDGDGPWHHTLTEDQDIGLRLLGAGWRCRHDNRATVDQQGLNNLRRLLRQRTRWAQGNLQAIGHVSDVAGFDVSRRARADVVWWLLQPIAAAVVGVGVFAAMWALVTRGVAIVPGSLLLVLAFFSLGFGGVIIGVTARTGRGPRAWLTGLAVGVVYSAYTWLLWPVLVRATWRLLRGHGSWAKTDREAIVVTPPAS